MPDLSRFIEAQENQYATALAELKSGGKTSHWMWFIFPQISGLGFSEVSKFYAIRNIDEAKAYLNHKVLGPRLIEVCNMLLIQDTDNATHIFGSPDCLKLYSSMTLFAIADMDNPESVFEKVLAKFFKGKYENKSVEILEKES